MILFKIGMSTKIIELSKFFSFLWKEKCISKCQIVNAENDFWIKSWGSRLTPWNPTIFNIIRIHHLSQQLSEPEYYIIDCRGFRWWWWYYDWWRKSHALRGGSSFEEIDRRLCHRWWHSRQRPSGLFGRPLCRSSFIWLAGWLAGHSILGRWSQQAWVNAYC